MTWIQRKPAVVVALAEEIGEVDPAPLDDFHQFFQLAEQFDEYGAVPRRRGGGFPCRRRRG